MTAKAIYFDMDGTIADLYGVNNWLEMLRSEDATPYYAAQPMYDMDELNAVLAEFVMAGWTIGVISWLAMDSSREYDKKVRAAKRAWLDYHFPIATERHFIKYGATKHNAAKIKGGILIDDNASVRAGWRGDTINANLDIVEILRLMLDNLED